MAIPAIDAIFPRMSDPSIPLELPAPVPRRWGHVLLAVIGCALLGVWAVWWYVSLHNGQMWGKDLLRIPVWRHLGLDFRHNYLAAQHWLHGGNPYLEEFGDWRGKFAYPPVLLPLFAWTGLFGQTRAMILWMGAITAIVGVGAWMVARTRAALGSVTLPLSFMLGLLLLTQPVLFATERGQADAVVLAMIVVAALALQRRASWTRDIVIGVCLAIAAWVKVYPVVLVLGLIALREWRALGVSIVAAALIGLIPYSMTMQFIEASRAAQQDRVGFLSEIYQWLHNPSQHRPAQLTLYPTISVDSHSLTTYWGSFWTYTHLWSLQRTPGVIGAALVLGPPTIWLSVRMLRATARTRAALAYPYLLWLAAMATFVLPVSYDYNLFFLPLAALAVCDRRDPVVVPLALIAMVVWAQPFKVPVPSAKDLLFFLKLLSLMGAGISLLVRAREQDQATLSDAPEEPPLAATVAAA
jgi:hypothetical protein